MQTLTTMLSGSNKWGSDAMANISRKVSEIFFEYISKLDICEELVF
jgi:hypothetical protein